MPSRPTLARIRAIALRLVVVCLASGPAGATDFTWNFTGLCILPGCNWSSSGFWSPTGIPGAGDTATIGESIRVALTQNVGALNGLTISNGARVHTQGYGLNAAANGANTFLYGTGVDNVGGNTRIAVDSGAFLGFDFSAFFLSMHQGAELQMNGGGAVASFGINVSASSLISGHGTVLLLGSGTKFDVAGHVRPSGGTLRLVSLAADRIDLDGNVGGDEPGQIRVTADGDLEVQGSLADPFSGSLEIGNSNDVAFDGAVEIDGQVRFSSASDNHLIAPSIVFGPGATIVVDGGIGHVDASSSWPSGATIELVAPSDELHLVGDSSFGSSTTWIGDGLLVNESPGAMTLADGSHVTLDLANEGALEIGDPIGVVMVDDLEQAGRLVFDIEGTTPGVGFDQLHVAGDLALSGDIELRVPPSTPLTDGDSFLIIAIDGVATGGFDGYAEGDSLGTFDDHDLHVSYAGGDGNDVVLLAVPEPAGSIAMAVAVAALTGATRRRSRSPSARAA